MKILRGKSLFGLIYACLLAFPLISIVSRVIYVQSNKNAYQSYSGTQQGTLYEQQPKYESNVVSSGNDIKAGNIYSFNDVMDIETFSELPSFYVSGFIINGNIENPLDDVYLDEVAFPFYNTNISFYVEHIYREGEQNSTQFILNLFNGDGTLIASLEDFGGTYIILIDSFDGDLEVFSSFIEYTDYNEYTYILSTTSTLDNVFEYSIDKTISDSNFGKINFLSWFTDLFLDNNEVNNRYVHYANWYMNYIMFVSCAYLLFLVLMWFINFARKLLDRGMNYDW